MKTVLLLTSMLALVAGSASAQYQSEFTENLQRDEVPVAVLQSLQNGENKNGYEGSWQLIYIQNTFENSHDAKLTPEFYRFACKMNGDRVEFFYNPDGILDHSYGVEESKTKVGR
jgi:hypothetical protein